MDLRELPVSLAAWLDSRQEDFARKAFAVASLLGVLALSIVILVRLYLADFSAVRILVAAGLIYGGMALGGVLGLLIIRRLRH